MFRYGNQDSPRSAVCLCHTSSRSKNAPFGNQLQYRGWMAKSSAASRIGARIIPAGIVGHQHNDIGRLRWSAPMLGTFVSAATAMPVNIPFKSARPIFMGRPFLPG